MSAPPTRILSWQQLVLEVDPNFARERQQPWIYRESNGRLFYAPPDPYAPLPSADLGNDGGVLYLIDGTGNGYPTSPDGLPWGAVWDNGDTIGIVPGATPQPGAGAMIFGRITASQLLLFGAGNLPTTPPPDGSLQLWNNGNLVCVA